MHLDLKSALAVLEEASARTSGRVRFFSERDHNHSIRSACDVLSGGDPVELLPILASWVWSDDEEIRNEISSAFLKLALRLPLWAWPKLDEDLRKYRLLPSNVAPTHNPASIVTAAFHPSGFVREQAMHLLSRIPPVIACCVLLIRVNDWVAAIRLLAKRLLPQFLALLSPGEKMRIFPLLQRLHECGRHDEPQAIGQWMTILTEPFDELSWLEAWQRCAVKDHRTYISLLQNRKGLPGSAVRNALLRSHNRFALMWYIQRILPCMEGEEALISHRIIGKIRAVPVRREWIDSLMKSSRAEALQRLIASLTDESRSLRSFARYHLSELAPMDFIAHYRKLLKDPAHEVGALAGLAEVEPDEAHKEALLRLSSGIPAVRKAAILALHKNSLPGQLDWLFKEAGSSKPGIAKAARKRLLQIPAYVGTYLLSHFDIFIYFALPLQIFCVRAAPLFGKWIALEFLLRCLAFPSLSDAVEISFQVWVANFNRSFTGIPNTKCVELIKLVETESLEKSKRDYLLFILRNAG